MSSPFLGQIELFAFGIVPRGWAACAGQLMPINQNQALYSLLGTAYGGDGRTNFALPDLRGRVPISVGAGFSQGQRGGQEAHALSSAEMPAHSHNLMADAGASPSGSTPSSTTVLGRSSGKVMPTGQAFSANLYAGGNPAVALNEGAIAPAGDGQKHENRMPSLALNFCICIDPHAIYPSRS
jgi:microcystin-dependent protein